MYIHFVEMNEIVYFSVWPVEERAHPMTAEKLQRLISPFTRKAKSGEVLRALDKSVLQLFLYVSTCRVDFWGILGNSLGAFSGRCGRPSGRWSSGQQGKVREMEVWRGGRLWYWQPTHFSLQSQILPPSRLLPLACRQLLSFGSQ